MSKQNIKIIKRVEYIFVMVLGTPLNKNVVQVVITDVPCIISNKNKKNNKEMPVKSNLYKFTDGPFLCLIRFSKSDFSSVALEPKYRKIEV